MLFGVYFPERLGVDRRWPWLKWLVGVPIALRALQSGIVGVFWGSHAATATAVAEFLHIGNGFTLVHLLAILCFFVSMGYKTFSATTPDARRRVSLLCAGTITSVTPALVIILVNVLRGLPFLGESTAETFVLYLMMLGFPLTIAYVICWSWLRTGFPRGLCRLMPARSGSRRRLLRLPGLAGRQAWNRHR